MGASGRKRVQRSDVEWRTILERFDRSGQTQLAFCREAGIPATTFQLWRRRLRQEGTAPVQFIDVTPPISTPPRWAIEIAFPDGTTARVRG
ncbi:MAG: hypothetical protein ABI837_11910 [Acidobacteriota bacterium]